ncbi:MAG: radical SAM family heme chaperone HemW [Moraxella sp.]|nr:radical SAM family heme chaperone HemW [Moraxella sp.]
MASSLGLYIHIPWCVKKCPYCDFNSHTMGENPPFEQYVDALFADMDSQVVLAQEREITSVFVGGGTPSLLPVPAYERLFLGLKERLSFSDDCEMTLEANPATIEHAPFDEYLSVGFNRLSIGVQSFDEKSLTVLGRIHSAKQAETAISQACHAGFSRVNADLMYGLPHQTVEKAVRDLKTALEAGVTHLSWYQLTIEPNTAFFRTPPDLPCEDTLADIESAGREILYAHGFDDYEVSAWVGEKDTPCRHNMNYWQFGDYLAIGAGAHGKISLPKGVCGHDSGVYRFSKSRLPKDYLNYDTAPKMVQWRAIDPSELVSEYMMNALRLKHGVSVADFERATRLSMSQIEPTLDRLKAQGLLVNDKRIIRPTALGFRYVNHLVQAFL